MSISASEEGALPATCCLRGDNPHRLAKRGAEILRERIEKGELLSEHNFEVSGGGKMLGVLVCRETDGDFGVLFGVSGMIDGDWYPDGFVPPLFERETRDRYWYSGEGELNALTELIDTLPKGSRRLALRRERAEMSRKLLRLIQSTYVIVNRAGERTELDSLFPKEPPGGAGDCAGPKLIGYANLHKLEPIALTEFWIGASTKTNTRADGEYYAPCENKCAPILDFMLSSGSGLS